MQYKYAEIGDIVYFWFAANTTAGSAGDGASPLYVVRLAGAASNAGKKSSGTPVLLSHSDYYDGIHEIAIDTTGWAAGEYSVFCSLTISSVNPAGFCGSFSLRTAGTAALKADVVAIGGMAQTATLDTIKAETTLIVADTNELQTDWHDGGRLDLLIDQSAEGQDAHTDTTEILTRLPDATAGTANGLPIIDATGVKLTKTVDLTAGQSIACSDKTGFSLSATGADLILKSSAFVQAIVMAVSEFATYGLTAINTLLVTTGIKTAFTAAPTDMALNSTVAKGATALDNTVWTNIKAGYIDAAITGLPTAASIKTAIEVEGSKLDHLWEMTEDDAGVRRFTANALEQTPVGGSAPTVTQIRQEIDANSSQLAAIVADTGELQTNQGNWLTATGFATPTNITAGTVTTVTNLTNAPTVGDFTGAMKTSLNAITPASVQNIPANGSGFTALGDTRIANLDASVSSRLASDDYEAPDNAGIAAIQAKTENLPTDPASQAAVEAALIGVGGGAGAIAWPYTLTDVDTGLPIDGAEIWVTTDIPGHNVIASGTTDTYGVANFMLDIGTVYVWRKKAGYNFSNPDTETVAA